MEYAAGLLRVQIRNDRFTCDRSLSFSGQHGNGRRKIQVDPAAKPDDPNPLACRYVIALSRRGHDPPGNSASNENGADWQSILCLEHESMTLVQSWSLRRSCVEVLAGPVNGSLDAPGYRRSDDVNIEQ